MRLCRPPPCRLAPSRSVAISGIQWQSAASSGIQWQSAAISGNHLLVGSLPRELGLEAREHAARLSLAVASRRLALARLLGQRRRELLVASLRRDPRDWEGSKGGDREGSKGGDRRDGIGRYRKDSEGLGIRRRRREPAGFSHAAPH